MYDINAFVNFGIGMSFGKETPALIEPCLLGS